MLPLWAIGALAGAGLGAIKGKKNEDKMKQHEKFREAAIRYSPWSGMSDPGSMQLPDTMSSMLSGAALGGVTGSMFGGAAPAATAATAAPAASTAVNTATGANVLGGGQLANSMAMTPAVPQMGAMGVEGLGSNQTLLQLYPFLAMGNGQ